MTEHFTLRELTKSMTATRLGFDEQFDPSQEVIDNLQALAENILQPLRDAIGHVIYVHSGYRCERLNSYIHGAKGSQHMKGEAVDIENLQYGNEYLYRKIIELKLPFDQLINEFGFDWIHVSYSPQNRRQILIAYKFNGRTMYKPV